MKKALLLACLLCLSCGAAAQERFQKLTDRFYYLATGPEAHIGALVSDEGVLLVNPPPDDRLPAVLDGLKRIAPGQVRWIVRTDCIPAGWYPASLVRQGASFFTSEAAWKLNRSPEHEIGLRLLYSPSAAAEPRLWPSFVFGRQIRFFAGGEVHLYAPHSPQRSSADIVVFVPDEKVLQVGEIFRPGSFPRFDAAEGAGAALGWMESLQQVIDLVPLLRSAMPPPKPESGADREEEEKTLEELVQVLPPAGPVSNLQEMKDLLEAASRMRGEIGRAVAAGRRREAIPDLPALAPFRSYPGFEDFALRLFDALGKK